MRIALTHDWLDVPGGSENVLLEAAEVFPDADIWSLWASDEYRALLGARLHTSWMDRGPWRRSKPLSLALMPVAWRSLPKREYDTVLSFSHCYSHMARFRGHVPATHLCYVHSPVRYVWTPEIDGRGSSGPARVAAAPLREVDRRAGRRHRHVAVNSTEVRRRVERSWGVESTVIPPPVDVEYFSGDPTGAPPFPEYVLGASRWIPYKRLDLVIDVGSRLGIPVVIAGSGPLEAELRRHARDARVPVAFVRSPSRAQLRTLYRGATMFVFPSFEDFGIMPVEAQAAGTPVLAIDAGGSRDTVRHGATGYLCASAGLDDLDEGARWLLGTRLPAQDLQAHAAQFGRAAFRARLSAWASAAAS